MNPERLFTLIFSFAFLFPLCATHASDPSEWHNIHFPWDHAPVNLSSLLDAPAGNHGFLGVKGTEFVFEDGSPIRFWGTTMTGSACYPPQDVSPAIAERLSQFGINLVRFQDWDASWAEPNLYIVEENQPPRMNPETLDRLDYFIYQLANRGIYTYIEGLGSRGLGDEVALRRNLSVDMQGILHFDQGTRQRYIDTLQDLWSHRNRYTNLEYRDTPAIVLSGLFPENSLSTRTQLPGNYHQVLQTLWINWLRNHKKEIAKWDVEEPTTDMQQFLSELLTLSHTNLHQQMRVESIKTPLSGITEVLEAKDLPSQTVVDFIAAQGLWNPVYAQFTRYENYRMSDISPQDGANLFAHMAFSRLKRKPFLVSEWGSPWPNTYRAELPLWMAAMACFQDWQGCVASTYRTVFDPKINHIFAPMESFNDPAYFGLFPAAALLFHRQDVPAARLRVEMSLSKDDIYASEQWRSDITKPTRLVEVARVDVILNTKPSGSRILAPSQPLTVGIFNKFKPATEFFHDTDRGVVVIDTPRTQALIGRLSKAKAEDLNSVEASSQEDFGIFCFSSLDKQALNKSKDILLTVLSEAQNQGYQSHEENGAFVIDNPGSDPVQIKNTPVRLFLSTQYKDWSITTLDPNGKTGGEIPHQIIDKRLTFEAGTHGAMFYRLKASE